MGSFSIWHWLIVLLVVVLVFGTKKLKNIGSDLGGAVKGFKEGLKFLREGDEAFLFLPYQLAYGEKGVRGIPEKSNLIFKVKVVEVID